MLNVQVCYFHKSTNKPGADAAECLCLWSLLAGKNVKIVEGPAQELKQLEIHTSGIQPLFKKRLAIQLYSHNGTLLLLSNFQSLITIRWIIPSAVRSHNLLCLAKYITLMDGMPILMEKSRLFAKQIMFCVKLINTCRSTCGEIYIRTIFI